MMLDRQRPAMAAAAALRSLTRLENRLLASDALGARRRGIATRSLSSLTKPVRPPHSSCRPSLLPSLSWRYRGLRATASRRDVEPAKPGPSCGCGRAALTSAERPLPPHGADGDATPTGELRDNIYTIPNLLTLSRIAACPVLGYHIVHGQFGIASALLLYAGLSVVVRCFA